ncbi:MAG: PA2169 family four-helix-bundle protein [Zoogloea sp.]|uniref:PA2169 family four-helix-bundle protein n=1 Tax=Zoogloea sp. TaxID=49181 RepID=UPI002617FBA4|nr:PA2169 family four-helix-bundle protein [Zoogloea sp.]MDD2987538.1 PA2169 family four-helix-bundle protein [Zoogloea sp.]
MNNTLIETQNIPQPTDGKITTPQPPSAEDKDVATKIGLVGGAASGVATGVAVGAATAGPVGAAVGGVIGAVAGAVGGKALADNIGPASDDDNYWANAHVREPYYHPGTPYAWYRPAYELGWHGAERYPGSYDDVELHLREDWLSTPGRNMAWDEARPAVKAAWERAAMRRTAAVAQAVDPDELVKTLNELLMMSRDGDEGFRHASEHAKTPTISAVLLRRAADCRTAVVELQVEIERLGGAPVEHGSVSAALHRGWTTLKTVFTTEDDKLVLDECIRAEKDALDAFTEAIEKPMPSSLRALVMRELEGVRRNHAEMQRLRDALA